MTEGCACDLSEPLPMVVCGPDCKRTVIGRCLSRQAIEIYATQSAPDSETAAAIGRTIEGWHQRRKRAEAEREMLYDALTAIANDGTATLTPKAIALLALAGKDWRDAFSA